MHQIRILHTTTHEMDQRGYGVQKKGKQTLPFKDQSTCAQRQCT